MNTISLIKAGKISNQSSKVKNSSFLNNPGYKDKDYVHYVYKIINNINEMYYIGIHSFPINTGFTPENDGYWGSGTKIREAIKKEGRSNFSKIILKTFSTRQELSDEEKRLVTIEEVRNPKCYNLILGGDDSFQSNIGWVICRPKTAIDKVIKIPREEYYENKNLYVPVGHIKYYLNGPKPVEERSEYKRSRKRYSKINNNDKLYSRRRSFVNKITLEIKTYIGHDEPNDLYNIWFPIYFYDKVNNKFISEDYFRELYVQEGTINKLAKLLKIGESNLRKIKDFYISKELLDPGEFHIARSKKTFSGKTFVNKDGKYLVIEKSDLSKYLSEGYELGKFSSSINSSDVINYYCLGNNLRDTAKKFGLTLKSTKHKLGLNDKTQSTWFHNIKTGENIRLLVNDNLKSILISNGWKEGRKGI